MSKIPKTKLFRPVIPICVILFMAYSEWAYSYFFCYKHVYRYWHNRASMIAFLVIANFFWLICLLTWILIFIKGPGRLPFPIPPYELGKFVHNGEKISVTNANMDQLSMSSKSTTLNENFVAPPAIFECDSNGLPFWCSECSTLKLFRSHHSSVNNRCIPLFDHFCSFLGLTIGKNNYGLFLTFVFSMQILLSFTWITIAVYSGIRHRMHAALIVFVIISGILSILVFNLIYNLLCDLLLGETTVERLNRIRWKKAVKKHGTNDILYNMYVNVQHPTIPGLRVVVALTPDDHPFNNGLWNSLKLWFCTTSQYDTPQKLSDFQYSLFSEKFKVDVSNRIQNGDYVVFGSMKNLNSVTI